MAAAAEAGGLIGPLWGGGLADLLGWRGVFWINLPLCLPLAFAIWRLVAAATAPAPDRGLDLPGAALLGASLVCLTIALTDDPIEPRPIGADAGAVRAALPRSSRPSSGVRLHAPLPHRRPARCSASRRSAPRFLTNGLTGGALIVAMVNVPLFTNVVLDGTALEGGLNLMRLTVALAIGARGRRLLATRFGLSAGGGAGARAGRRRLPGHVALGRRPGVRAMTLPLLVAGLGFGLVIAPVNTAVLDDADEDERATLAALLTVVRLVGALVGVALLTTRGLSGFYAEAGQVPSRPAIRDLVLGLEVDSFRRRFIVTAAVCFVALICRR